MCFPAPILAKILPKVNHGGSQLGLIFCSFSCFPALGLPRGPHATFWGLVDPPWGPPGHAKTVIPCKNTHFTRAISKNNRFVRERGQGDFKKTPFRIGGTGRKAFTIPQPSTCYTASLAGAARLNLATSLGILCASAAKEISFTADPVNELTADWFG